jgi:hypothetical protein
MARICGLIGAAAGTLWLVSACVAKGEEKKAAEPVAPAPAAGATAKTPAKPAAPAPTKASNKAPAKGTGCALAAESYAEVLDLKSPQIAKVIENKSIANGRSQTVQLKDGPIVKVTAGGCEHWGVVVETTKLPDGGTGMMPLYRVAWLLESIPGKSTGIQSMLKTLHDKAKELAPKEKPSAAKDASYDEACGDASCTFVWKRHPDMALDIQAAYSFAL